MSEIIVETTPMETVIEIEGGPTLTTVVNQEVQTVIETPAEPVVIDLNSGARGEPGSAILTGEAYPTLLMGSVGDIFIITEGNVGAGDVYTKTNLGWVKTGNIRGPVGGIESVNNQFGPVVVLTKGDVGLPAVDNTADVDKPVSTAQQAAITAVSDSAVKLTGAQTIAGNKTFTDVVSISSAKLRIGTSTTARNSLIADASGYASWGNPALIAASKTETDNSNTYAAGVYVQDSAGAGGWPEAYGVILTALVSNERAFQLSYGKGSNVLKVRAGNGAGTNGWNAWQTLANDSNVVHNTGNETIAGSKTFSNTLTVNAGIYASGIVNSSTLTNTGPIEIGKTDGTAGTPYIDFHAGATVVDYDARILVTTGTGVTGAGSMQFVAGSFTFTGGALTGNGSGLTALNGTQVTTGTVADARLSANVSLLNAAQTVTGNKTYSGTITVPTPSADMHASTKKYVDDAIFTLTNGSPALLNTLDELAAALGDDPNFATTVTNSIATKVSLTGNETIAGVKTFSGDTYISRLRSASKILTQTDAALGAAVGDKVITREHSHLGSTNQFRIVDMVSRRANTTADWTTTVLYSGIAVDTSFEESPLLASGSRLRSWTMRDPQNQTIAFGSEGTTYLTIAATGLTGNGSGLTALNGSNISTGTVADARLSTNQATLTGTQTFSGAKTFSIAPVVPDASFSIAKVASLQTVLDTKQPNIVIPEKGATDGPATYPNGTSIFETAAASVWPVQYGTVVTHYSGNTNRGSQWYLSKTNLMYVRSADTAGTNGWTAWKQVATIDMVVVRVVHTGSAWPARPAGATYVEWVGPNAPSAATANDTWVNTSV